MNLADKIALLEPENTQIPLVIQCALLGINRSSYYYKKKEKPSIADELYDIVLALHLKHPYMGARSISDQLKRSGHNIDRRKSSEMMKELKIKTMYPKPNLSLANKTDKKFPYLLTGLEITRTNQVWCTDITYIRTQNGFMYLTAIIDVYSRYIVAWGLSNSLNKELCTSVLEKALKRAKPEIINTDQGSQYTSNDFIDLVIKNKIQLSMDSKGRALDNIWIERFWRSIKYQEIFLNEYPNVTGLYLGIQKYIGFYNHHRGHQSLEMNTPASVYFHSSIFYSKKVYVKKIA